MKGESIFSCLVADPPWPFRDKLPGDGRGAAKHYRCLSISEIMRFPLPPLADDCWMFLWRVASQQQEALDVVRAWGFHVDSDITWIKAKKPVSGLGIGTQMGMGRTVRNCHEVCLVCRRGKPVRASASVRSVIVAPRRKHSEKPDEFFEAVEQLVGDVLKIELFARRKRDGWVCLGDEIQAAKVSE
jgi:N6-adenosine-specific RNA methylase IME4